MNQKKLSEKLIVIIQNTHNELFLAQLMQYSRKRELFFVHAQIAPIIIPKIFDPSLLQKLLIEEDMYPIHYLIYGNHLKPVLNTIINNLNNDLLIRIKAYEKYHQKDEILYDTFKCIIWYETNTYQARKEAALLAIKLLNQDQKAAVLFYKELADICKQPRNKLFPDDPLDDPYARGGFGMNIPSCQFSTPDF